MFKKINNLHLSILVLIASVLSLILVQQQVLAQWSDPIGLPGETGTFRIVVNPLAEDLNLGGHNLIDPATNSDFSLTASSIRTVDGYFSGNLCLNSDCISAWPSGGGSGLWSQNGNDIYYNSGNVGIGIDSPNSALEIVGSVADDANINLRSDFGDMKIIFQEYDPPLTPYGDISIRYNGNAGGYLNWLEFWGRDPAQGGGRPIMTMQRDYYSGGGQYRGVGIGVPSGEQIDAKLRVKNYGTEDILQLYDDTDLVFEVADNGFIGINGPHHLDVPLFINGSGNNGLKMYENGIFSYNNTILELKSSNDVYLNPGLYDGVGVEVVDPQEILHIKNPASFGNTKLRLENSFSSSFLNETTQMEFVRGPNIATDYSWFGPSSGNTFDVWTNENIPILFGNSGSEKMRIMSSGNVGIGTNNPVGLLDIEGGEICLNGDCISNWTEGLVETYTTTCEARSSGGPLSCTASCEPTHFILSDWHCEDQLGNIMSGVDCVQGVHDGTLSDCTFGSATPLRVCTGTATCSRYQ